MKRSFKKGFISHILVIIAVLLLLGYLGFNLRGFIESPEAQERLARLWGIIKNLWQTYLAAPAIEIWNRIVVGIFWETLKNLFSKVS